MCIYMFLNHAHINLHPAYAWLLEIDFVHNVCVCAYVSTPKAINN